MGRTDKEIYRVIDNVNSYYRINSESKKELLLNKYPNAAAAYSLRLLDGYYRGPLVRVRRDGGVDDGVEVDVYPDYNNQLSLDSLVTNVPDAEDTTTNPNINADATFLKSLQSLGEFVSNPNYVDGGTAVDATVCVWYDQSSTDGVPNDNDAKQAVATNQPLIVSSGVIVTENGKPALDFDGTNDGLNCSTNLRAATGASTVVMVRNAPTITTIQNPFVFYKVQRHLIDDVSGPYEEMSISTNNTADEFTKYASADLNGQRLFISSWDGTTQDTGVDDVVLYIDGASESRTNVSAGMGATGTGTNSIGYRHDTNSLFCDGTIQELIVYLDNQSSNRTGIEEDINSFYQIDGYTPTPKLIDLTQDLAAQNGGTIADGTPAAAYSLRLLSSTYNGPLVRIRRTIDNTEVDVYPDSDGEFSIYSTIEDGGTELTTGVTGGSTDKTTLHEFLYGQDTDCTVVRWYDQASGNHATQDVATSQPKIYDSTGGVVLDEDNNLPAALFAGDYLNSGTVTAAGTATNFAVGNISGGTTTRVLFFTPECFVFFATADWRVFSSSTQIVYAGNELGLNLHYFGADSDGNFAGINGGALTTSSNVADSGSKIAIGTQSTNVAPFYGYVQECIYYGSDQSPNRTNIESNINQHYNIY